MLFITLVPRRKSLVVAVVFLFTLLTVSVLTPSASILVTFKFLMVSLGSAISNGRAEVDDDIGVCFDSGIGTDNVGDIAIDSVEDEVARSGDDGGVDGARDDNGVGDN